MSISKKNILTIKKDVNTKVDYSPFKTYQTSKKPIQFMKKRG